MKKHIDNIEETGESVEQTNKELSTSLVSEILRF
jgi:hypothetical protein